jgi:hypothetical protein
LNPAQGALRASADVIAAFKDAGLEAEHATPMGRDEFRLVRTNFITATRFLIPSLGPDSGGRVFVFANTDDLNVVRHYYQEFGAANPYWFSWVFVHGNILVQINGDLRKELAREYELVLNGELMAGTPQVSDTSARTLSDVIAAFKAAGLEAANPLPMTIADVAAAPITVFEGVRFSLPSHHFANDKVRADSSNMGADGGGRIMIFRTPEDQEIIRNYYTKLGESSPFLTSWVFVNGNMLLQINGDLEEAEAHKYEAALNTVQVATSPGYEATPLPIAATSASTNVPTATPQPAISLTGCCLLPLLLRRCVGAGGLCPAMSSGWRCALRT